MHTAGLLRFSGLSRRDALRTGLLAVASLGVKAAEPLTQFQIACMTLAYANFPFERALKGIAGAGYKYVAWAPRHKDSAGRTVPVLAEDAPALQAKELAVQSRDLGLEPVMMFGVVYLEAPNAAEVYKHRIEQAAAAGIPYVLAFGSPRAPASVYPNWIHTLKLIGPIARAAGVTIVIKQHGGVSATGRQCGQIVSEVADPGIRMFYDAGNTRWYADTDPIQDIQTCVPDIRGFAIKDFRATPKRTICGPGFGEIDHYKLLSPVAHTGLKMPLACETIFAPYVPRPSEADAIDPLARRAREFLETVVAGLQATFGEQS
ncbi:MAG TPA: sugar phosphate isomerase/epimerase [Bryobacteraceae bacterium]|nr:sugar phosphate isomerase/epimerase [Bryobacteraceae bacterium]